MSTPLGDYVAGLVTVLAAGLTDTTFAPGKAPDTLPPASSALGFVWATTIDQDESNQLIEHVTTMVRIYPIQSEQFDGETPIDPTPLYTAAELLQTSLEAGATPSSVWFFDVNTIELNHDDQYIEATIVGTRWNDTAIGNS